MVFWKHNKGGKRLYNNHSCHSIKGNSIVSAPFFVLGFLPFRVSQDRYCVHCVDGEFIIFVISFSYFSYSQKNLSNKIVLINLKSKEIDLYNKIFHHNTRFVVTNYDSEISMIVYK
jgi:hypothetical protein